MMTQGKERQKFTLTMLGGLIVLLGFLYGILNVVWAKPASSKMSEENKLEIVELKTCVQNLTKQLDRIENKIDRAVSRNGNNKQN